MFSSKYQQLQPEERVTIASLKQQGWSVRAMARTLGRPASTISRELARNTCELYGYTSARAQASRDRRRAAARPPARLDPHGILWRVVCSLLDWKWSPQQISCTLKRMWPDDSSMQVSHETIYNAIYAHPRGELRRQLVSCLRQSRSTRMPRTRGQDRRGQIADMLSVHVRPPEVNDRVMPGHWEGDLIKGEGNRSAVGVLVERTSRLVLLAKMDDATAASALAGFSRKLNSIAAPLRQSLTYDQGKEMSRHGELTAATGVRVYFCDPHSPWQRGTCENTNGLLRQYLPKGTDLSGYSQDELDSIADSLNARPRATHDYHCPLEVFASMLEASTQSAASRH
jgi:transposase, IS30 family